MHSRSARSITDISFCINRFPLTLFFFFFFTPFIQPQKQNLRLATPRPGLLGRAAGTPVQLGQHEQQQGKTGLPHQVCGHICSYEDQAKSYFTILKFKHHSECADYWLFLGSFLPCLAASWGFLPVGLHVQPLVLCSLRHISRQILSLDRHLSPGDNNRKGNERHSREGMWLPLPVKPQVSSTG